MRSGNTIVIVVIVLIAVGVFVGLSLSSSAPAAAPVSQATPVQHSAPGEAPAATPDIPANLPPLSAEVKAQLATSHGFSLLVSFTGKSFEPADVSVDSGATVRFTNNSENTMHLCGDGVFAQCKDIASKGFWEYTFGTAGSFSYSDGTHSGVMRVK